jgi:hypothetical protein
MNPRALCVMYMKHQSAALTLKAQYTTISRNAETTDVRRKSLKQICGTSTLRGLRVSSADFPTPLDGETINSIASRCHARWGWRRDADTSQVLFGYSTAHRNWWCPAGLLAFSLNSSGRVLANEQTLRERTLLGPFLPLIPAPRRSELLKLACAPGTAAKVRAISGLSRHVESSGLLKACPACIEEQLAECGYSHWSSFLQWPGVWICPLHKQVLAYASLPSRKRTCWILPHQINANLSKNLTVSDTLQMLRLQDVMAWIGAQRSLEPAWLLAMVKLRLRTAGFLRSELKVSSVEADHIVICAQRRYSTVSQPDIERLSSHLWMETLLHEKRHYNPLTWAAALALEGSCAPETLTLEYREAIARTPQQDLFGSWRDAPRRTIAPQLLYDAFTKAVRKGDAVCLSQLTVSEVDRWLRRDSGLAKHWRSCIIHRRMVESRNAILSYVAAHPGCKRVDVLRSCLRDYRWLEENDPAALVTLLPPVLAKFSRQLSLDFEAWPNSSTY